MGDGMARPKNQQHRRAEVLLATQQAIAQYGLDGARLHRIAKRAGLSPGSVLYYYPEMDQLLTDAILLGIDRFDISRSALIEGMGGPAERIEALIRHGLPHDAADLDVRMFCQLGGAAGENPLAAALLTSLFDRQVALYRFVLEQGAAAGVFTLRQDSLTLARNIVALEDAYGYRIVARHPVIDSSGATQLILDYAKLATGHDFTKQPAMRSTDPS